MSFQKIFLCVCACALGITSFQKNWAFGIEDDFDDGVLSGWDISYNVGTSSWNYQESGTALTVTDIQASTFMPGAMPGVYLTKQFSPMDNFNIEFDFSWNSNQILSPVGTLMLILNDVHGEKIASAGCIDTLATNTGQQYGTCGISLSEKEKQANALAK